MENSITLNEVLALARRLSPIDKVRLIEQVAPQIERDLQPDQVVSRAGDSRPMVTTASTLADYATVLADLAGAVGRWFHFVGHFGRGGMHER